MQSVEDEPATGALVTVITVSLNAEQHIEQTIQSVLGQTWRRLEYIVVDGGSTDCTPEIISRYSDRISRVISEKDKGIADAMNKGFALAKGDYIVFLHADDYFANNYSLQEAMRYIHDDTDILACQILFGKDRRRCKPRGFNWWTRFKTGVFHQGTVCRRSLIDKLGGFDTQFQIVMDYDFFLRAYRHNARLVKAPVVLSVMRDIGVSTRRDWESMKTRFQEERRVHEKNRRSFVMGLLYKLYWAVYLPYRQASSALKNRMSVD